MKGMLTVFLFIALTALCWGVYGPVLHEGQHGMGAEVAGRHINSLWRPFTCVGLAYFGIAVLVPGVLLTTRGEQGHWSTTGTVWSLAAGAAGAIGALGIILAFKNHGNPLYVMPLVFGGAPVVNTFYTMFVSKTYKQLNPMFLAGLILVMTGAVTVLIFKPGRGVTGQALEGLDFLWVTLSVATTALCWGVYGPVLHKGQSAMGGSKLRPLMCVGLAYFGIAVVIPLIAIYAIDAEPNGTWANISGTLWSLAGGAAGAIGALGIIMAFNFGGKPIYVMPLVFGGAPVINTFTTIASSTSISLSDANPIFFAGLIVVAAGAVTVLVFAPRPGKPVARPVETPQAAGHVA
jgi:hypothetical protein